MTGGTLAHARSCPPEAQIAAVKTARAIFQFPFQEKTTHILLPVFSLEHALRSNPRITKE